MYHTVHADCHALHRLWDFSHWYTVCQPENSKMNILFPSPLYHCLSVSLSPLFTCPSLPYRSLLLPSAAPPSRGAPSPLPREPLGGMHHGCIEVCGSATSMYILGIGMSYNYYSVTQCISKYDCTIYNHT